MPLDGDLSPEAGESDIRDIGKMARKIGLEISGVCSFLFWPYSLTHEDPKRREAGNGAGHEDDPRRQAVGHRKPADRARGQLYSLAGGASRRCRFDVCHAPGPGGRGPADHRGGEGQGLPEHREHLRQRLPPRARRR